MGCSSLNIDGVSKRVVYSESVKKMLQNGIEKSNFSDGLLRQGTGYQAKLYLTVFFRKCTMPTWDEICQVLEELRTLIEEIQSELANPATVQERRPGLQQLLTACFATWDEIVEKYAERSRRG